MISTAINFKNVPADGRTVVFDKKPLGSYLSEGVAYTCSLFDNEPYMRFTDQTGAGTYDDLFFINRAAWHYCDAIQRIHHIDPMYCSDNMIKRSTSGPFYWNYYQLPRIVATIHSPRITICR